MKTRKIDVPQHPVHLGGAEVAGQRRDDPAVAPPQQAHHSVPTDEELDAMLLSKGYDPDRLLTRKETEEMLLAFGVRFRASTMGRDASTRNDGLEYQIVNARALMRSRNSLRYVLSSRASAPRRSPPPEARRPRTKPDKRPDKSSGQSRASRPW